MTAACRGAKEKGNKGKGIEADLDDTYSVFVNCLGINL